MKSAMRLSLAKLTGLLEDNELTAGMYVRVHGDNLIMGRREQYHPDKDPVNDDRVRLTRLSASTYGLSVRRHTGRWERTPFSGSMEDMVDAIRSFMQYVVAPTPGCTGTSET